MDKTNALSLTGGGMFDGGWTPVWLIKDEFTDTVAAGSGNGTAATPGPGTRTVVDNDGDALSIGSGVLSFANPNAAWSDPAIWYGALTRSSGLCLFAKLSSSGGRFAVGFDTGQSGLFESNQFYGVGTELRAGAATTSSISLVVANYAVDTTYNYGVCLLSTGAIYLVKGGLYSNWTVLWVSRTGAGNVYPAIGGYQSAQSADYLRVLQLPPPFDTDDGIATDTKSGSVAVSTTFSHTADMLLEFTVDTLPSAGAIGINFRIAGASQYWQLRIFSAGTFDLVEFNSDSGTQRAVAGSAVASGNRVVVIAEGTTIKGYSNNTLRWTYSSATNFATATAGRVVALGTGGAVSDLKTWPRTLSGTAASILNKASG